MFTCLPNGQHLGAICTWTQLGKLGNNYANNLRSLGDNLVIHGHHLGPTWALFGDNLGTVGAFLWNLGKTLGLLWHYWRSGSVQLPCRQHMLICFRFTALTWLRIGVVYEALHSFKEGLVLSWGYMAHHLSALQLTQHFRDYISSLSLIFSALVISFFSPYICKNFFSDR